MLLVCKIRGFCPLLIKPKAEISQAKGVFSPKAIAVLLQKRNMLLPFKYRNMISLQEKASTFVLEYEL